MTIDYIQIISFALLTISEILPFISRIKSNGILHTIMLVLSYIWIKINPNSELAGHVQEIRESIQQESIQQPSATLEAIAITKPGLQLS